MQLDVCTDTRTEYRHALVHSICRVLHTARTQAEERRNRQDKREQMQLSERQRTPLQKQKMCVYIYSVQLYIRKKPLTMPPTGTARLLDNDMRRGGLYKNTRQHREKIERVHTYVQVPRYSAGGTANVDDNSRAHHHSGARRHYLHRRPAAISGRPSYNCGVLGTHVRACVGGRHGVS